MLNQKTQILKLMSIPYKILSEIRKITKRPLPIDKNNWLSKTEEELLNRLNELVDEYIPKIINDKHFK